MDSRVLLSVFVGFACAIGLFMLTLWVAERADMGFAGMFALTGVMMLVAAGVGIVAARFVTPKR